MGKTSEVRKRLPHVVSTAQARAQGAPELRSRTQGLEHICLGLWRLTRPDGEQATERELFLERASAVLSLFPGSALTHDSAADFYGMPRPNRYGEVIHLWRPAGAKPSTRPGIRVWAGDASAGDVVVIGEVRVTSMRQTLLCAARTWDIEDLVAAIDWMVRRPRPWAEKRWEPYDTLEGLREWAAGKGRRRGIRRLREALKLARVGSDSPMETRLRLALAAAGLPEPVCNGEFPLDKPPSHETAWEQPTFQPDLAFVEWKVCVEYQGRSHGSLESMQRDYAKREDMEAAGWLVVYIHGKHMASGRQEAVARVRAALVARGWRPPAPQPAR